MDVRKTIAAIVATRLPAPLVNIAADTLEPGELLSERTANAKVYDLGGGRRQAKVYGVPVHYRDPESGLFRAVDPSVKRKPLADALQRLGYEAKAGPWHAHFDSVRPWNYRFEIGTAWVEYVALFGESAALDIAVETSRIGVKETITLKDKTAPTRLQWTVTRSKDAGVIQTPPPTAQDAAGKDVPVAVSEAGDVLTYTVDTRGATFPVTVDPTSVIVAANPNDGNISPAASDIYADVRNATTGYAINVNELTIGQSGPTGSYNVYRSFLQFDLTGLSAGLEIESVSLYVDGRADYSTTDFNVVVADGTYTGDIALSWFNDFSGWASSGNYSSLVYLNDTWNTSSYSADWNELTFNAAGVASVSNHYGSAELFTIVMLSENDKTSTAPTGTELVKFTPSTGAATDPYLSLTFTAAAVSMGAQLINANHFGVTTFRAGNVRAN